MTCSRKGLWSALGMGVTSLRRTSGLLWKRGVQALWAGHEPGGPLLEDTGAEGCPPAAPTPQVAGFEYLPGRPLPIAITTPTHSLSMSSPASGAASPGPRGRLIAPLTWCGCPGV